MRLVVGVSTPHAGGTRTVTARLAGFAATTTTFPVAPTDPDPLMTALTSFVDARSLNVIRITRKPKQLVAEVRP